MTPTLRKRHRQIWMGLALLLPLGFLSAWNALPDEVPKTEIAQKTTPLPEARKEKEVNTKEGIALTLYQTPSGKQQVEIQMMPESRIFRNPSIWAYAASDSSTRDVKEYVFLGVLEAGGTSRFEVDQTVLVKGVVIYDGIKKEILHTLYFP